jgi:hypothetical protein
LAVKKEKTMIGEPTYQVTARLSPDGEPTARVTAICPYGNRTVSHSVDITDEKALAGIGSALRKAMSKDVMAEAEREATKDAMRSALVAVDKGEDLTGADQEEK